MLVLLMQLVGFTLGIPGGGSSARQAVPIQFVPYCLCPTFSNFMNCFVESQLKTLFALNMLKWIKKDMVNALSSQASPFLFPEKIFSLKNKIPHVSSYASDHCSFSSVLLCCVLCPQIFHHSPRIWGKTGPLRFLVFTEAPSLPAPFPSLNFLPVS